MTLGRTNTNKIKIKADSPKGLRAVSCGCCGCKGLFKVAGVDFPMPVSTAALTQIGDGRSSPTDSQVGGYAQYTNLQFAPSASGSLGLLFNQSWQTGALNTLDFFYGSVCADSYAGFNVKATSVQIYLPTVVTASGELGDWECGADYVGSATVNGPIPILLTPPTCDNGRPAKLYDGNSSVTYTGSSYELVTGSAGVGYTGVSNSRVYVEDSLTLNTYGDNYDVGINGVTLKNLDTDQTFTATSNMIGTESFHHQASYFGFRPGDGISLIITFSGFNRTTPGRYELTWPLLRAPFKFTIQ